MKTVVKRMAWNLGICFVYCFIYLPLKFLASLTAGEVRWK